MSTTELETVAADTLTPHTLSIADFIPSTNADWPGHQSATILLQGCPWSCTYCFNPGMQDTLAPGKVAWAEVIENLQLRRGMLDTVVFSGGEPTRQPGLLAAIREVKAMGYQVGLLTAGAFPGRLAAVLGEVDWVGLDVKAAPEKYADITGKEVSGYRAWTALELVQHSGVDYEIRVTVDPTRHSRDDVYEAVRQIIRRGAKAPVLQEVRPAGVSDGYRAELGRRRLHHVIGLDDLPDLERR